MADKTKIEWAEASWSPITGCSPVSEGCEHCYARRMAQRLKGRFGYPKDDPFKVTYHKDRMGKPGGWRKPRMIFVCSMGDLFHRDVDVDSMVYPWIMRMVHNTPWHTYLFLTKRPQKMKWVCEKIWNNELPHNAWLGVTAENQPRADERIPVLLQIPAAKHFVSIEPMLSSMDISYWLNGAPERNGYGEWIQTYPPLDWVIVGGESGPGARPIGFAPIYGSGCTAYRICTYL